MRTLPPAPAALPRPHPFLSPPSKPPPPDPALRRGVRFSPSSASKPPNPGSRFSLTACFSAPHCHKALLMHDPSPPPLQTPQTPPKCVPFRPPCPYPPPTACHRLIIHLSGTLSPSPGNLTCSLASPPLLCSQSLRRTMAWSLCLPLLQSFLLEASQPTGFTDRPVLAQYLQSPRFAAGP